MKAPVWTPCTVTLGALKPWAQNPRLSTKAQAARLLASFKKFGQVESVAIGPDNEVYDGHQRLSALLTIHGPDYSIDARRSNRALTDDERRELVVALHIGAVGAWDWQALAGWDADSLQEWGMDGDALKTWNNDASNLKEMLAANEPEIADAEPQIDRAAELREKWQTERGQLWRIGEHRLLCGDSTKREDVERVMGGEKANGCFTSPPYAEQRKETYGGTPQEKYIEWWGCVQDCVASVIAPDGSFFVNIKPHCKDGQRVLYVFDLVLAMVRAWGWKFTDEIIWKRQGIPGDYDNRFKNQFEPIYHFSIGDVRFRPENVLREYYKDYEEKKYGPTTNNSPFLGGAIKGSLDGARPGNVLEINQGATATQTGIHHPATFPIGLPSFFVRAFSDIEDIWLEPFAGSGTTLVACQNLSRRCRAIEISPAYVAVTLERMATAFPGIEISRIES